MVLASGNTFDHMIKGSMVWWNQAQGDQVLLVSVLHNSFSLWILMQGHRYDQFKLCFYRTFDTHTWVLIVPRLHFHIKPSFKMTCGCLFIMIVKLAWRLLFHDLSHNHFLQLKKELDFLVIFRWDKSSVKSPKWSLIPWHWSDQLKLQFYHLFDIQELSLFHFFISLSIPVAGRFTTSHT